ncbi:DUF305 domain-containing protein [Deinococcus soli (ex Cha et al. 2016)]|uniref:DUF305 domain-containing protein n=1 Tax=Deinococcus soli (ex Cha et al. 2016) TaxID=1309411 RepID=UPI00199B383B|nr:DUF305 domain-containing protein [Deinococcus soli (ex Cha et al. 2016)]GGB60803.1 DUF305 domain-containing protein [Deinococcus soli (ex Cha et al. 2016)]
MQRRVQRHGLSLWAGGALAAAVLGVFSAALWPRSPTEGSADVTFARDMSAHHAQAVNMSVTLFDRARDPAVKRLAQDILLTQQAQIGHMGGWLMAWGRPLSGIEAPMAGMHRAHMGLASPEQERALQSLPIDQAETQYLTLMRRHHQGGVAMARGALKRVQRPEVQAFAQRVIVSQASEVRAIEAMLQNRRAGGAPTEEHHTRLEGLDHE